jgi:hypothetical protein
MTLVGTISRLLAGRVARQVLVGLAVIEGIFLAESLTGILERVLRHGGSALDVLGVLVLTSPEIFDFALPLAILAGVYFSLNASREDGEFIVCSAAGIPWLRIPGFVAVVGAAGFALCILVSGYVSPLAATLKRVVIYELQVRQIRQQISDSSPRDTIETYGGRTFIATSEMVGGRRHGQLFVHHPVEDDQFRVTQTRDWSVAGPDPQGSFVITFNSVLDYVFPLAFGPSADGGKGSRVQPPGEPAPEQQGLTAIRAESVTLPVNIAQIIRETDRLRQHGEYTFTEALAAVAAAAVSAPEVRRRGGEIVGRAILCPVAALFALAALAYARRGVRRYAALPAAAVGVLVFDTASRAVLGVAAQSGAASLALAAIGLLLAGVLPALALVMATGEKIIRPTEGRA